MSFKNLQKQVLEESLVKKLKDSSISREMLDVAILNGIRTALNEQRDIIDEAVSKSVRYVIETVFSPQGQALRAELNQTQEWFHSLKLTLDQQATTLNRIQNFQLCLNIAILFRDFINNFDLIDVWRFFNPVFQGPLISYIYN